MTPETFTPFLKMACDIINRIEEEAKQYPDEPFIAVDFKSLNKIVGRRLSFSDIRELGMILADNIHLDCKVWELAHVLHHQAEESGTRH